MIQKTMKESNLLPTDPDNCVSVATAYSRLLPLHCGALTPSPGLPVYGYPPSPGGEALLLMLSISHILCFNFYFNTQCLRSMHGFIRTAAAGKGMRLGLKGKPHPGDVAHCLL